MQSFQVMLWAMLFLNCFIFVFWSLRFHITLRPNDFLSRETRHSHWQPGSQKRQESPHPQTSINFLVTRDFHLPAPWAISSEESQTPSHPSQEYCQWIINQKPDAISGQHFKSILWHEQELHRDTELILSPAVTESTRTAPFQNLKYSQARERKAKSESGKSDQQDHENLLTVMAFFACGTLIYSGFSLFITAAQDILAGTYIQSSMVLIACILPSFVFTLIAPYFVQKISYFARFITVGLALPCGLLILALAEQVYWKLIGLGIASVGYSMSEMTVLGLTSFYREVALTAFSAGTGVGYVITPFYYTGKIWLHYYSLKICRRFWLAPISRVIFHNQLRAYHFWNWLETRLLRPQTIAKPPKSCLFTSGLKKMALTAIRGRNSWFLTKSERKKYKNRQRMLSTYTSSFSPRLITSSVLHLHHSWYPVKPH